MSVTFAQRGRPPPNTAQIQNVSLQNLLLKFSLLTILIFAISHCLISCADVEWKQSTTTNYIGVPEQRKGSRMCAVSQKYVHVCSLVFIKVLHMKLCYVPDINNYFIVT